MRKTLFFVLVLLVCTVGVSIAGQYKYCDNYMMLDKRDAPFHGRADYYVYLYDLEDTTTIADSTQADSSSYFCFDITHAGEYWIKAEGRWIDKIAVPACSIKAGKVYIDTLYSDDFIVNEMRLGDTYTTGARIMMYVYNRSGSAMAVGDAVTWNNTEILLKGHESDAEGTTATAEDLTDSSGYWKVAVKTAGTASTDSILIYGTTLADGDDHSALDTAGTTNGDIRVWPGLWSQVDSFTTSSDGTLGLDSIRIIAYPFMSIADAASKELEFAGIVYPTLIASAGFGWITIWGICVAKVDGAETDCVLPGDLLTCGTKLLDDANSAVDSLIVGIALGMSCDLDDTIQVFITGH